MTTTEQLFVLREQHIQRDVLRFRHRNDQQALLVRPIIQVEAVIISKCAGDGEPAFLVGRYESFQIINLRIVAVKRDAKAGISFSQLPNVPVAEKKRNYEERRFKHIFSKATGDQILALINSSIVCRRHNRGGDETSGGDDT